MYRTGQRFGAGYVIDVLLGKDNERIRGFGHQRLSTFGIGADLDMATWRSVFPPARRARADERGRGGLRLAEAHRGEPRGAARDLRGAVAARRRAPEEAEAAPRARRGDGASRTDHALPRAPEAVRRATRPSPDGSPGNRAYRPTSSSTT